MNSRLGLFAVLLAASGAANLASAQPTVSVSILSPSSGALVGDTVLISANTTSTYEIQGAQAAIGGNTVNLVYSGASWTNTLSLAGLPHGSNTLTVTATDDFGDTGQATRTIDHDTPPTLTITLPVNGTVARPGLTVGFSSTDDGPAGSTLTLEQASDYSGGPVLASGLNILNTNISLLAYDGSSISLMFRATDSANQLTAAFRQVYVQSSTNLVEVARVSEGNIVDVHSDRILFLVAASDATGPYLKVQSRADSNESVVFHQPFGVGTSFLAPQGAVSVLGRGPVQLLHDSVNAHSIYQWQSSNQIEQAYSLGYDMSLLSRGNYAAWTWDQSGGVYPQLGLLYLPTATAQVISNLYDGTDGFQMDVATNGDVVFTPENLDYQTGTFDGHATLMRYRGGTTTLLVSEPSNAVSYPKTDGANVFYILTTPTNQALMLFTDAGKSQVAQSASFGTDFLVNGGWLAYESLGGGQTQVWRRSPAGVNTQLTFYGTSSTLAALSPNGEVMFYNGTQLYLSRGTWPPTPIATEGQSSGLTPIWLDDRWYAICGRSLFQVYTGAPILAAPQVSSNMFCLDLIGAVGQRLITQTSTDCMAWNDVCTNDIADDANLSIKIPLDQQSGTHFYRLRSP